MCVCLCVRRVCVCVICARACVHVCDGACVCVLHVRVCVCLCVCLTLCVYMQTHIMYTQTHVYAYACVYVYVCDESNFVRVHRMAWVSQVRERDAERQTDRQAETERNTERDRKTEKDRQTEKRQREIVGVIVKCVWMGLYVGMERSVCECTPCVCASTCESATACKACIIIECVLYLYIL